MKSMLLQRVERGDVLKFHSIHIAKDSGRFKVNAAVQCQGFQSFDQMAGICDSEQQLAKLLNRLLQLHIWNAPEDAPLLSEWRHQIRQWIKTSAVTIEFSDLRIMPFKNDLLYFASNDTSK